MHTQFPKALQGVLGPWWSPAHSVPAPWHPLGQVSQPPTVTLVHCSSPKLPMHRDGIVSMRSAHSSLCPRGACSRCSANSCKDNCRNIPETLNRELISYPLQDSGRERVCVEGVVQLIPEGWFGLIKWGSRRDWEGIWSTGHSLIPRVEVCVQRAEQLAGAGLGPAMWRAR